MWARLWYNLLANQNFSQNKRDGFGRERATLGDEMIFVASSYFQNFSRLNIEQHECLQFFGTLRGSRGQFYILTEFSMHSCA